MNLAPFIPYIGTAAATVFGLGMWQYQLITKRRYEVVEQALTVVGVAARKLHYIRAADMDAKEQARRQPGFIQSNPWGTTYPRIQETISAFQDLDATGRAIAMHFGESAAAEIKELEGIYGRVCAAQSSLYFMRPAEKRYATPDHTVSVAEWQATLNAQPDGDQISREIDAVDGRIRSRFQRYLRPSIFRLFVPFWGWKA